MKSRKYDRSDFLEKGYEKSQCYLLRLGGMYVKEDKYKVLNHAYVAFYLSTFGMFIFFLVPYSFTIAIPKGEMFSTFQDLHYWIVMFGYSCVSIMYHMNRKSIDETLILIGQGFYTYDGDENDEDAKRIVEKNTEFLKKLSKYMIPNAGVVEFFVIVVPPILELLQNGGSISEDTEINPYLPIPLYTPWNQMTISGFLAIYTLMFLAGGFVILELLALSLGYSSFMVHYITQFSLLNNSITKMELRAGRHYQRITGKSASGTAKFDDPVFQKCMFYCLKQNIQHHQILLRWMKEASKFFGWALLCTFLATSILLATTGYLFIMANDSVLALVILIEVQVLELIHSYLFCWWGETLATESGRIPFSLWKIRWYLCDRKFNQTLHIMLSNSLTPLVPRDPILKLKASLEMYGSLISSGYTYFNVMRSAN